MVLVEVEVGAGKIAVAQSPVAGVEVVSTAGLTVAVAIMNEVFMGERENKVSEGSGMGSR